MKITLKLFATLSDHLPSGARANAAEVEVADGATPNQIIEQFKVPQGMAHLVLLNGVYLDKAERDQQVIKADDVLAIWPPVAGG